MCYPLFSDQDFNEVVRQSPAQAKVEIGGFFTFAPKIRVGVVALRPFQGFNELDRALIISHEFAHAHAATKEPLPSVVRLGKGTVSQHGANEIPAYSLNGHTLTHRTDGAFRELVSEAYEKMGDFYGQESVGHTYTYGKVVAEGAQAREVTRLSGIAIPTAHVMAASLLIAEGFAPSRALDALID